ncbi:DEAD/DEAH box helicase [[Limnothrix rosea] IAM M-220]|uniref:DEAD/DEAH box helicase n=1 Tax=[Limnothrix rosea] IAM M-220 TaxID=454133 RepID=UPI00095F0008|nr:DEAD/DEAH box helicase [[Limnothrix rosea] IAM M-220]OKH12319.1 hypothetical protein NIES208_16360 [[Limnothrix rosea] IAM M-220]
MQLRDYQQDLFTHIFQAFTESRRVMLQLPTGGGKTIIFSVVVHEFVNRGDKVLVLAHRTELIIQAAEKLKAIAPDVEIGIIKAGYKPNYHTSIQVASVQSLKRRLHRLKPEEFGLVIIDEAHHSTAATYRHILEHFPDSYQLGVTATPIRTNGEGFADLFDEMITGITVSDLIKAGYLSPFKLYAASNSMITTGAKIKQGDFSSKDVAQLNNIVELAGDLLQSYRQHANGLSCVIFAVNVAHSMAITQRYNAAGIAAKHLDGNTPQDEREATLAAFRRGELKIISNVGLFTEGLDIPNLMAVQVARPTKSLSLWLQMVGRVLRICEGKSNAIILDHTKNYAIHGLPTRRRVWSLFGVKQDEVKLKRLPSGEVILEPEEPTVIEETPIRLIEVSQDEEPLIPPDFWEKWLAEQFRIIEHRGYKKGWLVYRLVEEKPPLEVWRKAADYLNYQQGWAWHKWREHCQPEAA